MYGSIPGSDALTGGLNGCKQIGAGTENGQPGGSPRTVRRPDTKLRPRDTALRSGDLVLKGLAPGK